MTILKIFGACFYDGIPDTGGKPDGDIFQLAIPNLEVKKIFVERIKVWFDEETQKNIHQLNTFCESFINGDERGIENQLNAYLETTVGIHDYSIRQALKENYYHGLLVRPLKHYAGWLLTQTKKPAKDIVTL